MHIVNQLIEKDPYLKPLFETVGDVEVSLSDDYFLSLVSAIVSQQLSGKVAQVIYQRIMDYYDHDITPQKIINTDKEELRSLGISYQKINYLKSLAETLLTNDIDLTHLDDMSDETIIESLVKVKGIGRWTAQMFLMFSLGREDVIAPLDLGLRKAYGSLLGREISVDELEKLSEQWRPYRSIVSFYLWKYTEKN